MRGRIVLAGIVLVLIGAAVGIGVILGRSDKPGGTSISPDDPRLVPAVRAVPVGDADAVRRMFSGDGRALLVQHAEARGLTTSTPNQPACLVSVKRLDAAAAPPRMAELAGQLPDGGLPNAVAAERGHLPAR